jgi:hypothetical protein
MKRLVANELMNIPFFTGGKIPDSKRTALVTHLRENGGEIYQPGDIYRILKGPLYMGCAVHMLMRKDILFEIDIQVPEQFQSRGAMFIGDPWLSVLRNEFENVPDIYANPSATVNFLQNIAKGARDFLQTYQTVYLERVCAAFKRIEFKIKAAQALGMPIRLETHVGFVRVHNGNISRDFDINPKTEDIDLTVEQFVEEIKHLCKKQLKHTPCCPPAQPSGGVPAPGV